MYKLIKLGINNVSQNKNNMNESFKHNEKENKTLMKMQYNIMKM